MKNRITALLTLLCLMLALVTPVAAAQPEYDVNAALKYASEHWNDGKGLCAEFCSRVIKAGGLDIKINKGTGGCLSAVEKASGLKRIKLTLTPDKGSVTTREMATEKLDGDILAAGDLVVQYCFTHDIAPHVLICAGYDKDGYAVYYAHNAAMNKQRYRLGYSVAYQHTAKCDMGAYVVPISTLMHEHEWGDDGSCTHKLCEAAFEPILSTIKYTATVKKAVNMKDAPYAAANPTRHVNVGNKVTIVASAKNHFGNLWYKTDKGDWIYGENVTAHPHKYSEVGKCSCGYTFELAEKKESFDALLKLEIKMKNAPYKAAKQTRVLKKGSLVSIVASAKNHYGNLWYKTAEGDWIYYENITKHTHKYGDDGSCSCGIGFKPVESETKFLAQLKKDVAMNAAPYSAAKDTRTLKKNAAVNIVVSAKNHYGNLWYKTDKGDWIYCENVSQHTHSYANSGKCSCGLAYGLTETKVSMLVEGDFDKSDVCTRTSPYSSAKTARKLKMSEVLTIVASVKNSEGELWYKTAEGTYIDSRLTVAHVHDYEYEIGFCSCGDFRAPLELPLSMSGKITADYDVMVKSRPSPFAEDVAELAANSSVTVTACALDSYGIHWYKIGEDRWVESYCVDRINTQNYGVRVEILDMTLWGDGTASVEVSCSFGAKVPYMYGIIFNHAGESEPHAVSGASSITVSPCVMTFDLNLEEERPYQAAVYAILEDGKVCSIPFVLG